MAKLIDMQAYRNALDVAAFVELADEPVVSLPESIYQELLAESRELAELRTSRMIANGAPTDLVDCLPNAAELAEAWLEGGDRIIGVTVEG